MSAPKGKTKARSFASQSFGWFAFVECEGCLLWSKNLPEENRPAAARPSVRCWDLHRPVGFASRRCRRFALIGGGKNHLSHYAVWGGDAHWEEYEKSASAAFERNNGRVRAP
jgi:hypothetical protein